MQIAALGSGTASAMRLTLLENAAEASESAVKSRNVPVPAFHPPILMNSAKLDAMAAKFDGSS